MSGRPHSGEERGNSYLAFDLGASSGRAILGTLRDGQVTLHELHRFPTPLVERDGSLFWDCAVLWSELRKSVGLALQATSNLRSVSVDSWAVDYVPMDAAGQRLREPYCYRDPRTRGYMAEAFKRVPAEELYRRTGIQLLEINTLYQLLADLDHEPELVRCAAQRLPIADYLLYRLSGRAAVERTMASTTQLMDVDTGRWALDLVRRFGLPDTGWPEIVPPGTVLGPLMFPRITEGSAPIVVASCSHDTAAAVAAVPAEEHSSTWAYLSSGTWSLLGVERREPILTDAARQANFTNEAGLDGTFRFLKNLNGLWVLQECEREWLSEGAVFDHATLLLEAGAATPTGGRLDLGDSRFATRGEMTAKLLRCCLDNGLPIPQTRGQIVRLILESLAASYAIALRELEDVTGQRIDVLHVVGGGSQNTVLSQWTADACGCRVVAGPAEATALGNLLVQARALGDLPHGASIRDVVRTSTALREYHPTLGSDLANGRTTIPPSANIAIS